MIGTLVLKLKGTSRETLNNLLGTLYQDLKSNFLDGKPLIAGIDKANVAANKILFGAWKSPNNNSRGLLTGINQALVYTPRLEISILYAGTALNFFNEESILSNIGKSGTLNRITNFEPSKDGEPRKWLEEILDLEGCESVWTDPEVIILFYFSSIFILFKKSMLNEKSNLF